MRCVRHHTRSLNVGKLAQLRELVLAFNAERAYWVDELKPLSKLAQLDGSGIRRLRNERVKAGYASPNGLQARAWKLALTEAADLLHRHWQAQLVAVKDDIHRRTGLTDDEQHLLFYTLKSYGMLADVLNGTVPEAVTKKFIELVPVEKRRKSLLCWLRRRLRAMLRDNRLPVAQAERSVVLDANCYRVVRHNGNAYLQVASLTPRRRINLPLLGDGLGLRGNLRVTLDGTHVEVHVQHELPEPPTAPLKRALQGKPLKTGHTPGKAIDAGFTEVGVDQHGTTYGCGFGERMTAMAQARNAKGARRNKLRAVANRARERGDEGRARRIEANNLGTHKQQARLAREQAELQCIIDTALNQLFAPRPAFVVHEDLARAKFKFKYGADSNRALSNWVRGVFAERLEFKAQVRGSHLVAVNPAYSSQLCPMCGFVDKKNRAGDRFRCLHCRHSGAADQVAALNLLARASDAEISCWMPAAAVRVLLDERFKRRLEAVEAAKAAEAVTVAGRTSDVVSAATRAPRARKAHSGESRTAARLHPATARRANNANSKDPPSPASA